MGRKVNFAEKPKKGPGKKTKKQPAPKFSAKLLDNGKFISKSLKVNSLFINFYSTFIKRVFSMFFVNFR